MSGSGVERWPSLPGPFIQVRERICFIWRLYSPCQKPRARAIIVTFPLLLPRMVIKKVSPDDDTVSPQNESRVMRAMVPGAKELLRFQLHHLTLTWVRLWAVH